MGNRRSAAFLLASSFLLAQQPLEVRDLPADAPLALAATATPAQLEVVVTLWPGWYLYGRDTGGGRPVALTMLEGSAFAAAGLLIPSCARQAWWR